MPEIELSVDTPQNFPPGQRIDNMRTGEVMRVDGIRKGRTRLVWRIPVRYRWALRWKVIPWRAPNVWTFGGEVAEVPLPPHPKADQKMETEMFMTVTRNA